ncbi:MAG TPA: histidine kinase, partial [Thermoanaerobaculia bacterium]|nr:histidine kinase [Thermoanaerobaculia bacterium]
MTPGASVRRGVALAWPLIGTLLVAFEALLRWALGAPPLGDITWLAVGWLEWVLLAPLVVVVAERVPYHASRRRFALVHAVGPFVFSAAHSSIYFGLRTLTLGAPGAPEAPHLSLREVWLSSLPRHLSLDVLVYSVTVLAAHVVFFLRDEWAREEERLALEQSIARTELDALRMQLPPELIRQKLDAIEQAIETDVVAAERQIMSFSAFLRDRLRRSEPVAELDTAHAGSSDDDPHNLPGPLPLAVRVLFIVSVIPLLLLVFEAFAAVSALMQGRTVPWRAVGQNISLAWFAWPVTLLMVWLGSRVKRIAALIVAAAAVPPLWDLAVHTVHAGWPAARKYLLSSGRPVDFLAFFAIALGALAYQRYHDWRKRTIEVAELDAVLLRSRARLLRLQLNPHFLFNTLNSIAALLEDERDAARRMTARLRHFVDRVLLTTNQQEVPLGEELDLLATYFAIENVRFGERLQLELDIADGAASALVPSFLLQPLVENAR